MDISYIDAQKHLVVPIYEDDEQIILLCKDDAQKISQASLKHLQEKTDKNIEFVNDKRYNFDKVFEEYYTMVKVDENLKKDFDTAIAYGAKGFFEHILSVALKLKSSDIHIFDQGYNSMIKLRLNGQLRTYSAITKKEANTLIRIIKLNCNLDISRTVAPVEGRFSYEKTDCRVSIIPTVDGEKIDIRILGNTKEIYSFDDIGLDKDQQEMVKSHLSKTNGLILVTGPTGSGKSTTLFTMMHYLNNGVKSIISIEDPVEYKLDGTTQIQISSSKSIEFENVLKFVLRQDPEIINIGEIRDDTTARLAIRASNTGHLVLSTMHTNSSISTITRLMDLGIKPYEIISSLSLVISQRLIRILCHHCKQEYTATGSDEKLGIKKGQRYYNASHCKECYGSGYYDQRAIFEILPVTDQVKTLIRDDQLSYKNLNIISLKDHLVSLLEKGETSIEEISKYI